ALLGGEEAEAVAGGEGSLDHGDCVGDRCQQGFTPQGGNRAPRVPQAERVLGGGAGGGDGIAAPVQRLALALEGGGEGAVDQRRALAVVGGLGEVVDSPHPQDAAGEAGEGAAGGALDGGDGHGAGRGVAADGGDQPCAPQGIVAEGDAAAVLAGGGAG